MPMQRIYSATIRVMGPALEEDMSPKSYDETNQEVVDNFRSTLADVETQISASLPERYYAKIEE